MIKVRELGDYAKRIILLISHLEVRDLRFFYPPCSGILMDLSSMSPPMLFEPMICTAIYENELHNLFMTYAEENFIYFKLLHDGHLGRSIVPAQQNPANSRLLITFESFTIFYRSHPSF